MKLFAVLVFAMIAGAGAYLHYGYPPNVLKRETAEALQQFSDVVATKDRAKISATLETFLTDDAKIKLAISFFSITRQTPSMTQEFDKKGFIHFIDTVLYPMTDYGYDAKLETFALSEDYGTAAVTFSSKEWSDGNNYYGGIAVNSRFSSTDTLCKGQVAFVEKKPKLREADCSLTLMIVPKPGEASKMKGQALQDYLTK